MIDPEEAALIRRFVARIRNARLGKTELRRSDMLRAEYYLDLLLGESAPAQTQNTNQHQPGE
jgi:hypothetical protein